MPDTCLFSAPAYACDRDQVTTLLASNRLSDSAALLGLQAHSAPSLGMARPSGQWLDRDLRQAELPKATDAEAAVADIAAWWPVRGGYGCMDLIDCLLRNPAPMPLLGFSDITILHACAKVSAGPSGMHTFMPLTAHGQRARHSLQALWQGQLQEWQPDNTSGPTVLLAGQCTAPVFAGCLSVLAGLAGTAAMPDFSGHILMLEDIDERPYAVDRCLQQLQHCGALKNIAGLVFGRFPWPRPASSHEPSMESIWRRWARDLRVPCLAGLPFGHESDPISIAQNRISTLQLSARQWLFTQHAV